MSSPPGGSSQAGATSAGGDETEESVPVVISDLEGHTSGRSDSYLCFFNTNVKGDGIYFAFPQKLLSRFKLLHRSPVVE